MFHRLISRICFKWSWWIVVGFFVVYVYLVALYFLYSNQSHFEKYSSEDDQHPIHVHDDFELPGQLPAGFKSWAAVMEFRKQRYAKAKQRVAVSGADGENGWPVKLSEQEKAEADRLFSKETFNVVASNKVAMDRLIPDTRHSEYVMWLNFTLA